MSRIVVLGAGPAGLGVAFQLTRRNLADVTVIEQRDTAGGNSSSFEIEGLPVDYGSHRLHPSCDPRILSDLRTLLGDDLLLRPRHGRIRLRGHWIHFPLKPLDLGAHLPASFAIGVARDTLTKPWRTDRRTQPSFASVLEAGLGPTICRDFYFPYCRKIWGLSPDELSPIQALRRVSGSSPLKLARKVLRSVPGFRSAQGNSFYYPKKGFGQISSALKGAAEKQGASFLFNASVRRIELRDRNMAHVWYDQAGRSDRLEARNVWSTIPATALVKCLQPAAPARVLEAAASLEYRAMILIYLVLDQEQFTEYDAHYFPEEPIPISRLSEPRNYSLASEPSGRTVLCAELPCDAGSEYWGMTDDELGAIVRQALAAAELPVRANVRRTITRRLSHAYPLYRIGYERHFQVMDEWLDTFENVLSFGRQGLFAHDNTHHALSMAYAAVECLNHDGGLDRQRWHHYRKQFDTHVVED